MEIIDFIFSKALRIFGTKLIYVLSDIYQTKKKNNNNIMQIYVSYMSKRYVKSMKLVCVKNMFKWTAATQPLPPPVLAIDKSNDYRNWLDNRIELQNSFHIQIFLNLI